MIKVKRIEVAVKKRDEFFSDAENNKIPAGLGHFIPDELGEYTKEEVYEIVLTHNFIKCYDQKYDGFYNYFKCSVCNFTLGKSLFENGPYSKLEPSTCKECIIKGLLE